MNYKLLKLFIIPFFIGFKFLPDLIIVPLSVIYFLSIPIIKEKKVKLYIYSDYIKSNIPIIFLFISYFILPFYIFLFNSILVILLTYKNLLDYNHSHFYILSKKIYTKYIIFYGVSLVIVILSLIISKNHFSLNRKILISIIISLIYSILMFYSRKIKKIQTSFLFIFIGQLIFIILTISNFKINWCPNSIITGLFVVTVISILIFVLDMATSKEIIKLSILQYMIFISLGNKAYMIFLISFMFFYIINRAIAEVSFKNTNYKKIFTNKNNLYIYLIPFALSLISLFLNKFSYKNKFGTYYYAVLISSFSVSIILYLKNLYKILKIKNEFFSYDFVKKWILPELSFIFYLLSLHLLNKYPIMILFIIFLSTNIILVLFQIYKHIEKKNNIINKNTDILIKNYLNSILTILFLYFVLKII